MIKRLNRIRSEFGVAAFAKTLLLLFGLLGMAVMGIVLLGRFDATIIAVVGLAIGALFRGWIVNWAESLPKIINIGLGVYGIVLFFGDFLKLDAAIKLAIISLTTVLVFNLQFWSLSDLSVYKGESD